MKGFLKQVAATTVAFVIAGFLLITVTTTSAERIERPRIAPEVSCSDCLAEEIALASATITLTAAEASYEEAYMALETCQEEE